MGRGGATIESSICFVCVCALGAPVRLENTLIHFDIVQRFIAAGNWFIEQLFSLFFLSFFWLSAETRTVGLPFLARARTHIIGVGLC